MHLEKSRGLGVDVRDFFTDEELKRLLSENELFEGHLADWTALQRYNRQLEALKREMSEAAVKFEQTGKKHDFSR